MTISLPQIRAARAMLELTLSDVHARTGISKGALSAIETGKADPRLSTVEKLRTLFADLGVEFLPATDELGPGIRLKKPVTKE